MTAKESVKLYNDLYNGKEVLCYKCLKGYFRGHSLPKESTTFTRDKCGHQIIFN